jgi:hypothetical protein
LNEFATAYPACGGDFRATNASHNQPTRKLTPPIGVIAPSHRAFVTASK